MYVVLNENNYIYSVGSEKEPNSIYFKELPDYIWNNLGCYQYINNEFILDENKLQIENKKNQLSNELSLLLNWFKWYDEQTAQYQRSLRLGEEFDRDINELDAEAKQNSLRIREIRTLLA